jgi:ABC-type transport system involved in cytochrome c biogenesis permease subunit
MSWLDFPTYLLMTSVFWLLALVLMLTPPKSVFQSIKSLFLILGWGVLITFTISLWLSLERPPFRTLAETRLWYGVFISTIGIVLYYRWRLPLMLAYTLLMAMLFLFLNFLNPDTFDKSLMPALQSPWFVPHVVVYIIGYAFLGFSSLIAMVGLLRYYRGKDVTQKLLMADNIVYIGFAFLTYGLLFGALWAKEAWGHYWTWDPKETWAFLTWLAYLLYIHYRLRKRHSEESALWIVALAFVVLMICWFGINYLPSASSSVHTYST